MSSLPAAQLLLLLPAQLLPAQLLPAPLRAAAAAGMSSALPTPQQLLLLPAPLLPAPLRAAAAAGNSSLPTPHWCEQLLLPPPQPLLLAAP